MNSHKYMTGKDQKKADFYKWIEKNLTNKQKEEFWSLYTSYILFNVQHTKNFWRKLWDDLKR